MTETDPSGQQDATIGAGLETKGQKLGMSYDLAVWSGDAPADDAAALAEYLRRTATMERVLEENPDAAPGPSWQLRAFLGAALQLFPELTDESGGDCPWASAPLIDEAVGDFIYFPLTYSGADCALAPLVDLARRQCLICFDPQQEALLSPAG